MKLDQRSVISGWIKGVGGDGVISLMHRYRDANGQQLNSTSIGGIRSNNGDWIQTAMIEHPEYTQPGANADFIISANGKIDALIDDLEVFTLATTADDLMWAAGDFESHYNGGLPRVNKSATSPAGTVETSLEKERPANGKYCLRMRGIADWATTTMWPVKYDARTRYTLTGKVRVNSGRASIRIDFYKDENGAELLGSKTVDATESKDWQALTVDTTDNKFDTATHICATAVSYGDTEAFFDQLVLQAR